MEFIKILRRLKHLSKDILKAYIIYLSLKREVKKIKVTYKNVISKYFDENYQSIKEYSFFYEDKIKEPRKMKNKLKTNIDIKQCESNYKKIIFLDNVIDDNFLKIIEDKTFLNFIENIPIFLYFDYNHFEMFLSSVNISDFIKSERFVFLVGSEQVFWQYFMRDGAQYPWLYVGSNNKIWMNKIKEIRSLKEKELLSIKNKINSYYENLDWKKDIELNGKRILFATWINTPTEIICTNVCNKLKEQGIDCKLSKSDSLIEKHCIERDIWEYKPNIIIHALSGWELHPHWLPKKNVVNIDWIQDTNGEVFKRETVNRMNRWDFILCMYENLIDFKRLNYPENKLINYHHGVDQKLFKTRELSEKDLDKYTCDLCIVTNCGFYKSSVENIINQFHIEYKSKKRLYKIADNFYKDIYDGKCYYSRESIKHFLIEEMDKMNIHFTEDNYDKLAFEWDVWIKRIAYKNCVAEWLIDAGYQSLKLYGRDWIYNCKALPFSQGLIKNGKPLSKALQCAKIVIGDNINTSYIQRAAEAMFSGALYIAPYIPKEYDAMYSLFELFEDGKNIVVYYSKLDLIEKINYYLSNEDKRRDMAEKEKKRALEVLTYDYTAKEMYENLEQKLVVL